MSTSLAATFLSLAALFLLLAGYAIWQSVRALFGLHRGEGAFELHTRSDSRTTLLDEKKALLQSLKDLEYEKEVGKISVEDFEQLSHAYRARAKAVLQDLDEDLGPFKKEAEALLEKALRSGGQHG